MNVRFHTDMDHRVLCARFIGAVPGPDGLNQLRAYHEAHPAGLVYNQIFDMRSWAGYLADQDLVEHFRWVRRFRQQNGLEMPTLPINVYLAMRNVGASAIVKQLGALRGQPIQWASSVAEAWELCAPGIQVPASVTKFFKAW
jgi:hypothetical protein